MSIEYNAAVWTCGCHRWFRVLAGRKDGHLSQEVQVGEKRVIIMEGKTEDLKVRVSRKGRNIVIATERSGVAKSVLRVVVETLSGDRSEIIGFKP